MVMLKMDILDLVNTIILMRMVVMCVRQLTLMVQNCYQLLTSKMAIAMCGHILI